MIWTPLFTFDRHMCTFVPALDKIWSLRKTSRRTVFDTKKLLQPGIEMPHGLALRYQYSVLDSQRIHLRMWMMPASLCCLHAG